MESHHNHPSSTRELGARLLAPLGKSGRDLVNVTNDAVASWGARGLSPMGSDAQQDGDRRALSTQRLGHDFSVVLAKTIESVQRDPAQFRNLIYEMARVHLQREAWRQNPPMNILELRRMRLALETAIERVETRTAQGDDLVTFTPGVLIEAPAQDAVVIRDQGPEPARVMPNALAHAAAMLGISAPLRAIVRLGRNGRALVELTSRQMRGQPLTVVPDRRWDATRAAQRA